MAVTTTRDTAALTARATAAATPTRATSPLINLRVICLDSNSKIPLKKSHNLSNLTYNHGEMKKNIILDLKLRNCCSFR